MSSAQAVSVHHNLLQLLSTESAAFSGLSLDSPAQGGVFSEALINSMKEQGVLSADGLVAQSGGTELPAVGDELPSGGGSLVSILQQSLNGGQLDRSRLEAAGLDADAIENGALEVVQLLAAAGRGEESAIEDLDKAFQNLQQLLVPPSSGEELAANATNLEVRTEPNPEALPDKPVLKQNNQAETEKGVVDARSQDYAQSPSPVQNKSLSLEQERAESIAASQQRGANQGAAEQAESPLLTTKISPANEEASGARGDASEKTGVAIEARAAVGSGIAGEPLVGNLVDRAVGDFGAESRPPNAVVENSSASNISAGNTTGVGVDVSAAAVQQSEVAGPYAAANSGVRGDAVRPDAAPVQNPSQSPSIAETQAGRIVAEDKNSTLAASTPGQNGSSTGEQRGEGDSSRQENFRNNMANIRAELAAAGGGSDESSNKEGVGAQGFTSIAAKQAVANDSSARNMAAVSNFQQLQSHYKGDAVGEVSLNLPEKFGSEKWTPGLSQRVVWMSNQQVGRAEIRLDPPELGSMIIRLNIQNDQASLSFTSPHAHVREILEQQMPRLREMLAENGIELQHSDVSDQSPSQHSNEDQQEAKGASGPLLADDPMDEMNALSPGLANAMSMVDYYA